MAREPGVLEASIACCTPYLGQDGEPLEKLIGPFAGRTGVRNSNTEHRRIEKDNKIKKKEK